MEYLSKAWATYKNHFSQLSALGIAAVLLWAALQYFDVGALSTYFAIFLQILAFKVIEGKVDQKDAAIQALWAWVAQILAGIGIVAVAALGAMIVVAPAMAGNVGVAIAGSVLLAIITGILALRFVFIPYFAHKGAGPISAIQKSWECGWDPAIIVGLESILVLVVSALLAGAVIYPAAKGAIDTAIHTYTSTGVGSADERAIIAIHAAMNDMLSGTNVVLTTIALIILGITQPMYWLIIYYGAKDGEEKHETSVEQAQE